MWRRDRPKPTRAFRDEWKKYFLMSGLGNAPIEKPNYISRHQGKRSPWDMQMEKKNDLEEVKVKLAIIDDLLSVTPKPCPQILSKGMGVTCVCRLRVTCVCVCTCVPHLPRQASTSPCILLGKEIQELECQRPSAVSCGKAKMRHKERLTWLASYW